MSPVAINSGPLVSTRMIAIVGAFVVLPLTCNQQKPVESNPNITKSDVANVDDT